VNLKFAELYYSSTGSRVFSVVANGSTVLSNFDIVAQSGGKNIAIDKSLTVNVTGGQLTLQFVAVIQYPKVNAIEILAGGSSAPSIPSSTSSGTIRVNAGGSSYTDSHGNAWSAD